MLPDSAFVLSLPHRETDIESHEGFLCVRLPVCLPPSLSASLCVCPLAAPMCVTVDERVGNMLRGTIRLTTGLTLLRSGSQPSACRRSPARKVRGGAARERVT